MEQEEVKVLTVKEERFCQEYIKDFNATKAAERAKYSKTSARQIGSENLSKPYIKNRIAELLEANEMGEGEIKKRFSDIAKTDMGNYVTKRKIPYTPMIKAPLKDVIAERRAYIAREEEFCSRMGFTESQFDEFQEGLNEVRAQVLRMEIELEQNPKAYRIVEGETVMQEIAEFDMVKLINDKERGVIKSIKHTKDGIQAESYSADGALTTLAKFKGMLVEKSEVDLTANIDTVVKIGYGEGNQGA
ncbi:MAG: terminase small subunit [Chryseobacterium sp.]|nr:MAG: terminase small subunit [Chryseobacterium sp.]